MPNSSNKITQFWLELKRRKVVRRNMVYAASGFVILELVSIIAEPLGLPDGTLKVVFILLCLGFVISIILSWFYDFTPDGLEKIKSANEYEEASVEKPSRLIAWKIATYISIVIIVGFIIFNIAVGPNRAEYLTDLEKSIAVLPFENMSVDEEYSHIGDAITDEIILELQKIKEFDRVLSRTSTMQYKDNRPTIPEIAEKLGVNYIIEGSIQRHREDVSIRVQVIRAEHEDHIWAEEYDGKWEDIFSIQDEMALKVANELKTVLSPEEIDEIGGDSNIIKALTLMKAVEKTLVKKFGAKRKLEDTNDIIYYRNEYKDLLNRILNGEVPIDIPDDSEATVVKSYPKLSGASGNSRFYPRKGIPGFFEDGVTTDYVDD